MRKRLDPRHRRVSRTDRERAVEVDDQRQGRWGGDQGAERRVDLRAGRDRAVRRPRAGLRHGKRGSDSTDSGSPRNAALGALGGPLHGGAPSRALDTLEAIGDPANTERWVEAELAAGRRIMGFGHAVYRHVDPRSALLREIATELGGEL
ncbi:MAG TPA: citrate/2-methylcitrate synthase, partial [Candidatus Limnocylindrales bacterium]|nr:citrate/2-methylcitrate synthase [Candidatus Limnocylindrales bacterium]